MNSKIPIKNWIEQEDSKGNYTWSGIEGRYNSVTLDGGYDLERLADMIIGDYLLRTTGRSFK